MTPIFHLSIYSLTTLAALMLTIAEEFPFPTIITVLLAPAAYVYNERRRVLRLNAKLAGQLGIAALLLAAIEFFGVAAFLQSGEVTERRVLAGAHFLGYLTWISLFQDKKPRHYWWLAALGLIQVAVGSILTSSPVFGVFFCVYFFLGLWTLSVFSLFHAEQSFLNAGATSAYRLGSEHASGSGLIAQLVHHQPDDFRNSIQLDPDQDWINKKFVAGVVGISIFAAGVGAAFFILTPRIWAQPTAQSIDIDDIPLQTVTGFREEVSLGSIGQILESNAKAFEVRFYDAHRETEVDVLQTSLDAGYSEPTFRGSVMGIYENGRWSILPESKQYRELTTPSDRIGDIKQSYVLADPRVTTLFCMQPTYGAEVIGDGSVIGIDIVTSMLIRSSSGVGLKPNYEVFMQMPRGSFKPRIRHDPSAASENLRRELLPKLAQAPKDMPQLTQLAQTIRAGVVSDDEVAIARAIEFHLGSSGQYTYSLKADVTDPNIDPVEDFLFNRKQGHCEYFASSMALMLRSLDIPTRLVSGYKGGEKNAYSGAWVVEQRHAHAWVEAYVNGRWHTFDPTPSSRGDIVKEIGADRGMFSRWREAALGMWSQNVVRMSLESQSESIYRPMLRGIVATARQVKAFFSGESADDFLEMDPRQWFNTKVFVGVFIFLGFLFAVRAVWLRYRPADFTWMGLLRKWHRWFYEQWLDRTTGRQIEFYDKFVRILRQHGVVRSRAQTPLEFARAVEQRFAEPLAATDLTAFPTELVSLFYEVRFGNGQATSAELARLAARLQAFATAISKRGA